MQEADLPPTMLLAAASAGPLLLAVAQLYFRTLGRKTARTADEILQKDSVLAEFRQQFEERRDVALSALDEGMRRNLAIRKDGAFDERNRRAALINRSVSAALADAADLQHRMRARFNRWKLDVAGAPAANIGVAVYAVGAPVLLLFLELPAALAVASLLALSVFGIVWWLRAARLESGFRYAVPLDWHALHRDYAGGYAGLETPLGDSDED